MSRFRWVLALCFVGLLPSPAWCQTPTLIVENGRVIVDDRTVLERASVVIAGDRILRVTDQRVDASNARRVDAGGRTVLPGLIDAHVHLTIGPGVTDSASLEAFLEQGTPQILREFLRHGVTTVRSTGDYWPWIGRLRDRIARGDLEGPRLLTAGRIVTFRDAHPATTVCGGEAFCRSNLVAEVASADEARTVVERLAAEGVDFVKLVSDSILVPVQIPEDVTAAIITQAHRSGLQVVGHVAEAEFMRKAAAMGMDGFVHPPLRAVPPTVAQQLASDLVQRGTPVATTMSAALVYSGQPVEQAFQEGSAFRASLSRGAQRLATMAEAGVQLVVGTDWCPCGPGVSGTLHPAIRPGAVTVTEMEMLGWGGLPADIILAAATTHAARSLGLSKHLGTLEAGKLADLIVVDGNPLDDLRALRNVRVVVKAGQVVVDR